MKEQQDENTSEYLKAENKIKNALNDGEWHRPKDLKEETRQTAATLSKHLKRMVKGIVEKRVDTSGNAPYPVYYRLKNPDNILNEANIPRSPDPETYFQNVSSAFNKAVNNAYGSYRKDGNFEAFQQNLDLTLGSARASLLSNVKYEGKIYGKINMKKG